ncbi:hypothetical protein AB0M39_30150 [Streptomyces sp. NPDC051907]
MPFARVAELALPAFGPPPHAGPTPLAHAPEARWRRRESYDAAALGA